MMNDNYDEKIFSIYKQRCESENPYLDEKILRVAYEGTIKYFV